MLRRTTETVEVVPLEERRESSRRALYLGEGFPVSIKLKTGADLVGETVSLSIGGMAIAVPEAKFSNQIAVGEEVELVCQLPGYKAITVKARLANRFNTIQSRVAVVRLGFEYVQEKRGEAPNLETRRSKRMSCSSFFSPSAYAEHPLFFNEHLHFQIGVISRFGLGLISSARNRAFVIGMPLKLKVLLPMQGEFQVDVVVRNLTPSATEKDKIVIGVEFEKLNRNFMPALSEYLISFTSTTLEDLRNADFEIGGIEKGLSFQYPESESDWQEVLELRFKAYKAAGKFGSAKSPQDMVDEYDSYARQLICKNNGKVIACLRVVFVNGDLKRSEHARLGIKIPEFLGANFVEVSRAATDPAYRGSDVFVNLVSHSARITYQAGCRYLVLNCNANMWPTYQKAGCKKTGVQFDAFGTTNCSLVYADVLDVYKGFGGGFFGWHFAHFPMAKYLNHRKKRVRFVTRAILAIHRVSRPMAWKIIMKQKNKKRGS